MENKRKTQANIDTMFIDRWSPRAYSPEPLSPEQIQSLFEAAKWAPSCYNEQPWLFLYAREKKGRDLFLSLLVEQNVLWAKNAPMLVFILSKKNFAANHKPNRHAAFDAGAAWMSLALQARRLGLYAHAMAGFNLSEAYKKLGVPEEKYEILAAIAVGKKDNASTLPEVLRKRESPNERKDLSEICKEGFF